MRFIRVSILLFLISLSPTLAYSEEVVPNEVIIKYKDGIRAMRSFSSNGLVRSMSDMPEYISDNTYLIKTDKTVEALTEELKDDDSVEFIQPNYIYKALIVPNDPVVIDPATNYYFQKGVGVNAYAGWDIKREAETVVVGVLDSGIYLSHEDLRGNIANYGIDVISQLREGFNAGVDDNGHGTHVAGLIGAVCDNALGACGIAWRVKLLPLKVLNSKGLGTSSGIIKAIDYAVASKVNIINASLGGDINQFPYLEYSAIKRAVDSGIVVVAAAGNADKGRAPYNTDIYPAFPAAYGLRGVISVGASNSGASSASFSYYGPTTVHLFAPGVNIYSTYLNNGYERESGTSMATPIVTGVVALLLAKDNTLTPKEVEMILINSVDTSPMLRGLSMSNGIINLEKALSFNRGSLFDPPYNLKVSNVEDGSTVVNISWEGGSGETEIYVRTDKGSYNLLTKVPAGIHSYTDFVDLDGSSYRYRFYRIRSVKNGVYSPFVRKDIATDSGSFADEHTLAGVIPTMKTRITENGNGGCSISYSSDYLLTLLLISLLIKSAVIFRRRLS